VRAAGESAPRRRAGTGQISADVLVDVLAQAGTYQAPDQAKALLREWAAIAVAVLDDRHRTRRQRPPDDTYSPGSLFCSMSFD